MPLSNFFSSTRRASPSTLSSDGVVKTDCSTAGDRDGTKSHDGSSTNPFFYDGVEEEPITQQPRRKEDTSPSLNPSKVWEHTRKDTTPNNPRGIYGVIMPTILPTKTTSPTISASSSTLSINALYVPPLNNTTTTTTNDNKQPSTVATASTSVALEGDDDDAAQQMGGGRVTTGPGSTLTTAPSSGAATPPPIGAPVTSHEGVVDSHKFFTSETPKPIRNRFCFKVFLTLLLCFSVSLAIILLLVIWHPARAWMSDNSWLAWICLFGGFFLIVALAFLDKLARLFPLNLSWLLILAVTGGVAFGYTTLYGSSNIVIGIASGMEYLAVLFLALVSAQRKLDMASLPVPLCLLVMVCAMFGFSLLIFRDEELLHILYAAIAVLLFSEYLLIQIQRIVLGWSSRISTSSWSYACLRLMTDVVRFVVAVLRAVTCCCRRGRKTKWGEPTNPDMEQGDRLATSEN